MISIHSRTNSILSIEFWKYIISRNILKKTRGPDAVRMSLLRGLKELSIPFHLNPLLPCDQVIVLSGKECLADMVIAKKSGRIKTLIVGPNCDPDPTAKIYEAPEIDAILVPSKWTADYWSTYNPMIANKIRIWPAGVATASAGLRNGSPIIYDKMRDPTLLDLAKSASSNAIIVNYNTFAQNDYIKALEHAPYMIYLARSESQGLALQEAWARNVPTFINRNDQGEFYDHVFTAEKINAPYLVDDLGGFFSSQEELRELIDNSSQYEPKKYCDVHLSDIASTKILIEIIHESQT